MYDGSGRRRAREFRIFAKDQDPVFLNECAIGNELLSLG